MVAPPGDCSIAITRDCFEIGASFFVSLADGCAVFAGATGGVDGADVRFFASLGIVILRSVQAALRRTTEAPLRRLSRRGGIPEHIKSPDCPHYRSVRRGMPVHSG